MTTGPNPLLRQQVEREIGGYVPHSRAQRHSISPLRPLESRRQSTNLTSLKVPESQSPTGQTSFNWFRRWCTVVN